MTAVDTAASPATRARRRQVLILVIGVALLRVAIALAVHSAAPERTYADDSLGYVNPAVALVEDHAYRSEPGGPPEFFRTPGYPVFLAVGYGLGGRSWAVPLAAQAALSALGVGIAYALARRLGLGHGGAMAAAVLVAFEPFQTTTAAQLMTESLATVLLLATAYAAVRWAERLASVGWAATFGLLLTVATMVRPTTLYLTALGALAMVVLARRRAVPWRVVVASVAAFLAPAVLILGAWSVRNHQEVGTWRVSASDVVVNYWYRAGAIVAERDGIPWDPDARVLLTRELVPGISRAEAVRYRFGSAPPPSWKGSIGSYYAEADARSWSIVFANPTIAANEFGQGLYSIVRSTGWPSAARVVGVDPLPAPVDWLGRIAVSVAMLAAGIGVVSAFRRGGTARRVHVFPVLIVGYVILASSYASGLEGHRFRAPVWPIIAVYTVIGAQAVVASAGARRTTVRPRA